MKKEKKIDQKKRKENEKKMKKKKCTKIKTILHDAEWVIKKEHHGYIHHRYIYMDVKEEVFGHICVGHTA